MKPSFELEKIAELFLADNKLAKYFTNYEYRPQQQKMALKVADSFLKDEHSLIEAGTGTGKSLAYLIPAIFWSLEKEEQVIVSTNTINLQEQLIDKDLPLLKKALQLDFNAVLMKGRRNYLCKRKFFQAERSNDLKKAEYNDLSSLNQWLIDSKTGCRADLHFTLQSNIWQKVCSESDLCLRGRCPYYGRCYFVAARNEAREADLLVVNHHLLFADLALRKQQEIEDQDLILPAYDKLIFDEAHNIEDIATMYLGFSFNQKRIIKNLNSLYNKEKNKGLLLKLRQSNRKLDKSFRKDFLELIDSNLLNMVNRSIELAQDLFNQVIVYLKQEKDSNKLRLTEDKRANSHWLDVILVGADNLLTVLNSLNNSLKRAINFFTSIVEPDQELDDLIIKTEAMILFIANLRNNSKEFFESFQTDYIYWIENRKSLDFKAAPLNIGEKLYNNLLKNKETVIFTSATLTIQDSFSFIKESLGLNYERINELKLGSPFDYSRQLKIAVINNLVTPGNKNFTAQISQAIERIIQLQQGRSLVLFTSYRMLNQVYDNLAEKMPQLGIENLYCQGKGSRNYLINSFKSKEKSVLLGTDSFWEGVDIPGDKLSNIIIVKLPFLVPSEPVTAARIEALEDQGLNSFMNYMVPRAVIKLRQGVGRLIRTKEDTGWVIMLDNRLLKRRYGRLFLNSLPIDNNFVAAKMEDILKNIKN